MKVTWKRVLGLIAAAAAVAAAGWTYRDADKRERATETAEAAYTKGHELYHQALVALRLETEHVEGATYWCPMHPEVRRTTPGTCPICSMALVLLEEGHAASDPGALALSDRQVQQAGVRTEAVEVRDLAREIDAAGRISVDERRYATITSWIPGRSRIERLHVDYEGALAKRGEILVELYNPTLTASLDELRLARETLTDLQKRGGSEAIASAERLVASTTQRVARFGLSPEQVTRLEGAEAPPSHRAVVAIEAPIGGTVIERLVDEGRYVDEGEALLRLADLSQLWVLADVYEFELPLVSLGQEVEITVRSVPGRTFAGTVSFIDPVVQERTRTVRVRCDLPNPDRVLKPGMYAQVRLRSVAPAIVAVSEGAVLQSGRRNVVIVSEGGGRFRPRVVRLGRRYLYPAETAESGIDGPFAAGDERYHEVLDGLEPGDVVVAAGAFLLNAEAQFQGILKKMLAAAEAAERAPKLTEAARARFDSLLEQYLTVGSVLVLDDLERATKAAADASRLLVQLESELGYGTPLEELRRSVGRMARAVDELARGSDLATARRSFAALSREIVSYLRDLAPSLVEAGDLRVFRCPMADDEERAYGFELWVQRGADVANPYMGPMMPG